MPEFTRRDFVAATALAAGAAIAGPARAAGAADRKAIYKEIERRHDESVKRLQEWIRPSVLDAVRLLLGRS